MLSFFTTVSILYLLYYIAVMGHDLLKSKDKLSNGQDVAAVHIDFNVQHRPQPATVSEPEPVNTSSAAAPTDGEGKKNNHGQQQQEDKQSETQPAKEGATGGEVKEGLMDAEELQSFLDDLNIEFIQPDFEPAKPVTIDNINKDAKSVAR
jgi:hypothetical protein